MYAVDWTTLLARTHRNCGACAACPHAPAPSDGDARGRRRLIPIVSGTVWALGFTSLLTDVSSEMVASILPMYLVLQLGLPPLAFGVVDGLYQGVAALVRLGAGVVSDRSRRYKSVAVAGYAMSAVCRLALLAAGGAWGAIAAIVAMDRIGKGVRTAPRDALIALRSPCRELASAFGVHRALDAAGAMLGPLAAFVLLAAVPRRFDVVFVASFAVALVGVSVIVLCVDPIRDSARRPPETISTREIARLCRRPDFRALLAVGFLLGLPTISDGFIFLVLQRRLAISFTAFPLFYVATSLFTAVFAIPLGKAADRVGRRAVFLGGYVLLAIVYASLFVPLTSPAAALLPLGLLGGYYAATDGVLTAMAASALPAAASGSGLALLATSTNVARLIASILFGLLWSSVGVDAATATYLIALSAAIAGAALVMAAASRPAPIVAHLTLGAGGSQAGTR